MLTPLPMVWEQFYSNNMEMLGGQLPLPPVVSQKLSPAMPKLKKKPLCSLGPVRNFLTMFWGSGLNLKLTTNP